MKNIMTFLGATIIASFIFVSCGQTSNKEKELELKERELALKEKEMYLDSIDKSKKVETTISNSVNTTTPTKEVVEKNKPTQNKTVDRDKFIGKFTWSGQCARGCSYRHIFQTNGKVKTTFESAEGSETNIDNWSVDENGKVIKMGNEKWFYKFSNGKIKLTSCEYPLDTHELSPEK